MEIAKHYDPATVEDKWYADWLKKGYFKSKPDDREPFTIVIPPPNVTGVLHMGHMLNNTLQDVLIRKARMEGKNTLWVPGTDHAAIATEAKVVAKLKEEGIEKKDISREAFMEKAWEWKEEHGGIILEQLKKLGASCDWDRTRFTMEPKLSEAVIKVFVDLYGKGLIYRGVRMVNWDPKGLTAVSDEEVIHKDVNGKLYHVAYKIQESDETITIATTRPETILGDTAICVNPEDERYAGLKGKMALVPLIDRPIPIIYDTYVDMEFGTGALKVTPAHDVNDYELGIKHKLESIDILNDDGTLNEHAQLFVGEDREVARDNIEAKLKEEGFLIKTEEYSHSVGFSERTDSVIEPKLSMQWFCNMEKMAKPALDLVMDDTVKLHPSKFKATYKHWMEDVRDWCISRQLWWGQQIPAWYDDEGNVYVAETGKEAEELAGKGSLTQDEDVLDTWFSSWLWPISVFDGILEPDNDDINYYYPTNDIITGPDILFFWIARMIMAGIEYRGEKPFSNVYLTGMVRDNKKRKMSKSLGNSPDPMELMEKYSADGVRTGMLFCSPAGNDLLFDEALCEQGRNFCNKIWNSTRLIKGWDVDENAKQEEEAALAVRWFKSRFNEALTTMNDHYSKYRISDALMTVYKLIWDDFCSWYLEAVKPGFEKPIDGKTYAETVEIFEGLLKVLHPFMPFISEEIWHLIGKRKETESLVVASWPLAGEIESSLLDEFEEAAELIRGLRTIRKKENIPFKQPIKLIVKMREATGRTFDPLVSKLVNLEEIEFSGTKPDNSQALVIGSIEYFVPMTGELDTVAEAKKLQSELDYTKGFLSSIMRKLENEKFVNNAPDNVVAIERKKQTEAEERISVLEEQIQVLGNH